MKWRCPILFVKHCEILMKTHDLHLFLSLAWVDTAFGPFWAFQKGWLSWLSGVTDNALYPILFLDCLVGLMAGADPDHTSVFAAEGGNPFARWSFIVITTLLGTYLNFRGLDIVGNVAIVICLLSLMPFVVFCVYGAFEVVPARWLQAPVGGIYGVDWCLLLNTFFWNINFWVSKYELSSMYLGNIFVLHLVSLLFFVFIPLPFN